MVPDGIQRETNHLRRVNSVHMNLGGVLAGDRAHLDILSVRGEVFRQDPSLAIIGCVMPTHDVSSDAVRVTVGVERHV
jgi:predicted fused transcriptional regulator/phosphomethylpyrimidine kinase